MKDKKKPNADRKPTFTVRLPERLGTQLDKLVDLAASDRSEEVRKAVIEYLERRALWPPEESNK